MAAEGFLNSLSSIMYGGQIFGIMPVLHRRGRRRRRRGRKQRMQPNSLGRSSSSGEVCWNGNGTRPTVAVLNPHNGRVFGEDDANGIVNITNASDKDYVKSDKSSNAEELTTGHYVTQFNWKCLNTVYSLLLIALGSGEWLCTVHELIKFGFNLGTIGAFNFYTIANFSLIMFFNLARNWPQLFGSWSNVAQVFDELPYRGCRGRPGVKIRTVFCIWTLAALVDTVLFRVVSAADMIKRKRVCKLPSSAVELIYRSWRQHVYHIIDFKLWHIPFLEMVNISLTFTWTYLDVFIMMIAIGLCSLFDTLSQRIENTRNKKMPYTFWIEIRTHYVILRNLMDLVDERLAILIVISFASNLYFICLQLFNSFLHNYKSWIHMLYFCNTLVMVLLRATFVLKYASGIGAAARRPLAVLKTIPTEFWNDELQRLSSMISHDLVALSGCHFFHLSKSLFLSLAGTVATYELVILDTIPATNATEEESGIICDNR